MDKDRNPKVHAHFYVCERRVSNRLFSDIIPSFSCFLVLQWAPSKLESISEEMVDRYFSKVDDAEWEDLKLPVNSRLPAYAIAKL